ncbi:MAG: SBBP repeat-containing protein [Bacteroidetes bacterium]|nr:SBBP repeat-containing protein [Bacteroidota bacterium]
MKKLFLIWTVALGSTIAHGQTATWLWTKGATGINADEGYGICTDTFGNVFITGEFASPTITFGNYSLTNSGSADIYIVKYNSSGNVLWAKSAGGVNSDVGFSVSADGSGNVFVTGFFNSPTITFGSTTLTSSSGSNIFIAKYDVSGNVLWAKCSSGNATGQGISISADNSGNAYISGYFGYNMSINFGSYTIPTAGGQDIFLVKYNSSGNVVWAKSFGGSSNDFGNGVSADNNGNIFLTGYFASSTANFGSSIVTNSNAGFDDVFIAKCDSSGNVLWAKSAGGNDGERGWSVTNANGNTYICGYFSSSLMTIGNYTLTNTNNNPDVFIAKYDVSGNVLWAKSAGGSSIDYGFSVSADTSENVYMTGRLSSSSITFGSLTLVPPSSSPDPMFIVKYDSAGNALCASVLSSGGDDQNCVSADRFGNAYITGDYMSNPFIVGTDTLILTGQENIFVSKYRCETGEGINFINEKSGIKIYPNPFTTQTVLRTDHLLHNATLTVDNCFGQTVAQIKNINGQTVVFSRDNLASGLYFVRLTEENKTIAVDKLVITDK